jgi:anti-anti-sigma factor
VEIKEDNGDLTFVFTGQLDTNACLGLWEQIELRLKALTSRAFFDMGGVEFVSSAFIRICLQTARLVPKGKFSLIRVPPIVKRTFKIAGLDEILSG